MFEDIDPFTASPAELLAQVADLEPGPFVMSVLLMIDRAALNGDDAITFLQVHERVTAWWASLQTDALVAAASPSRLIDEFTLLDPRPGHDEERTIRIEDAIREELAAAVRWSLSAAQHRIDSARLLAGPLAETRLALARGEITAGHVAVVVEAAGRLPGRFAEEGVEREQFAHACAGLQTRVLPIARRGTLSSTKAAARRAVLAIDAEGERRRRDAARCTRSVFVVDELDGISTLIARMSTASAHAVFAEVNARAHADASGATGGSAGSATGMRIDERRAEALAKLVLERADISDDALRVHLDVVIDLDTLLGLDDEAALLRGSGPIAADIVRDLLADPEVSCVMRRLVVAPLTGQLMDVGRTSYEVPDRLRTFITTRDGTCRFPDCRRRASRCQIDHALAWDDGGGTDVDNLGALCVRHHQLKTHGGWQITESDADGRCAWISPQGRRYVHEPGRVLA